MKVIVFHSPERKAKLKALLKELKELDVTVIDSPQTFGKDKFWMRMAYAFALCLNSEHDNYLLLHDDVCNVDLERINEMHQRMKNMKYTINVVNDARVSCWGSRLNPTLNLKGLIYQDYFDCLGLTNRNTLSLLNVEPVPLEWFDRPDKSSGVGFQLTNKFRQKRVLMYTAEKSLVYHGDHESVMHREERKRTPLISR
jgi:hypothetical protein